MTPLVSNFKGYNIETRFYSDEEAEGFLISLRTAGISVFPFFREDGFISWVLSSEFSLQHKRTFAFSSGASVPGAGSKTLIPAFCALHGIEVMGPDAHVASLARHKFHTLSLLQASGIPTPRTHFFVPETGWLNGSFPTVGQKIIIKPSHEAASIGIDATSVVEYQPKLDRFIADKAHHFRQPMTVQEFVNGFEIEVPLFRYGGTWHTPMPVGLSLDGVADLGSRFLDYDTVADDRYQFYDFSSLSQYNHDLISTYSIQAASLLGMRDFGRVDFRVNEKGDPYVIDISTSPYISRHSSFAFVASTCGGNYSDLPLALLAATCERGKLISF